MRITRLVAGIVLSLFFIALPVLGADLAGEKVMPTPACAEGWFMDGTVAFFDKDSLFDRINGESELYFPYGFERLAYARYENNRNPKIAIDADVYTMGSLLDAFGMFANYRRKEDAEIALGANGTVSSSQLFFYQDKYFIRLQATGATTIAQDIFLACAKGISRNLPQSAGSPKELEAFAVPAVSKKSVRYIASSLLGYDFFRRGLIADAELHHEQVQVFVVLENTPEAARTSFDRYRAYLKTAGSEARVVEARGGTSLEALDPLYGTVVVEQAGKFLIGAIRIKNGVAAKQLIGQVRARLSDD